MDAISYGADTIERYIRVGVLLRRSSLYPLHLWQVIPGYSVADNDFAIPPLHQIVFIVYRHDQQQDPISDQKSGPVSENALLRLERIPSQHSSLHSAAPLSAGATVGPSVAIASGTRERWRRSTGPKCRNMEMAGSLDWFFYTE